VRLNAGSRTQMRGCFGASNNMPCTQGKDYGSDYRGFARILSLVILEGLLSVDNAMVLAAMVSHLSDKEQKIALRWGCLEPMCSAAWRCCSHRFSLPHPGFASSRQLSGLSPGQEPGDGRGRRGAQKEDRTGGLWATVISVQFVDLGFSIDNIIAAVALSNQLWW